MIKYVSIWVIVCVSLIQIPFYSLCYLVSWLNGWSCAGSTFCHFFSVSLFSWTLPEAIFMSSTWHRITVTFRSIFEISWNFSHGRGTHPKSDDCQDGKSGSEIFLQNIRKTTGSLRGKQRKEKNRICKQQFENNFSSNFCNQTQKWKSES